jgi:hypothetical protein
MVRAILDGAKTQTRRVVKPQPKNLPIFCTPETTFRCDAPQWVDADCVNPGVPMKCPYGQPGDQLWVKETARLNLGSEENVIQYRADMAISEIQEDWFSDDPVLRRWIVGQSIKPEGWRPSILMPRRASRITLEITGIRVERLNDISEADAKAEGCNGHFVDGHAGYPIGYAPQDEYRTLWESINGPGSWAANPWVWVVEFRKVKATP